MEHVTTAASHGCLEILEWVRAIDRTLWPSRDCMGKIMVGGHVGVFGFLNSLDPNFLPERYQASVADIATMWHHDMIVVVYYLKPELVPLKLLYRHAMKLCVHSVVIWTGNKIYETTKKIPKLTANDLDHALHSCAWLLVEWIVKKDQSLLPDRKQVTVAMKANCSRTRKDMADFLTLLRSLYELANRDSQYLPTYDEMYDQPVEYVQWVHSQNPGHLSQSALIMLCKAKSDTAQFHEWISRDLSINVATSEMASAAANIGNVKALSWIIDKNPDAAPSRESVQAGLKVYKNTELLLYVHSTRPEHVPDVEFLVEHGYHKVAPGTVQRMRNFQSEQRNPLRDTLCGDMVEAFGKLSIEC
ncbi:hypothetical protein PSACC_01488 [Paramicrosporidium saccamoebae]|uniref:Uncharacterized protein n=1 Tax=Paramicrosporidium saccamoebae TaxID=1246581 RepID=A0A2H9TLN5_9FUNG|nr:hypothetical protein PSACC_01488 [Paramicrosporidium saccamoebae]